MGTPQPCGWHPSERNLPFRKTIVSLLLACFPFSPDWATKVFPSSELEGGAALGDDAVPSAPGTAPAPWVVTENKTSAMAGKDMGERAAFIFGLPDQESFSFDWMMRGVTWFHVSIVAMRVLTDPVGPGLVVFCGLESGGRFAADPEEPIRRYGKVLALWLRRPQANRCFHSGKLIPSFHRVPGNDHTGGGETRGGSSPPFGTILS